LQLESGEDVPTIEAVKAKPIGEDPTTEPAPRFLPLETIPIRLEGPSVSSKNLVFGVISNMSESGACVITNRSLPKDAIVRVTIAGGRAKHMNVAARVIWCAERLEPVKEIVGYLTGLTFENDSEESVSNLLASGIFQLVP
jgi:hypothetical protein